MLENTAPSTGFFENMFTNVTNAIINFLLSLTDKILVVCALAIIGYIVYQAIKLMWFGRAELTQKALFGYFAFLLVRILQTIIHLKMQ